MIEAFKITASIVLPLIFWFALMVALFDGVRRLSLGDRRRATLISVSLIGAVCVLLCAATLWAYFTWPKHLLGEPGGDLGRGEAFYRNLPADFATKHSKADARWSFITQGQLLNYLDQSGEWKKWQPSQDDVSDREQVLSADWTLKHLRFRLLDGLWFGMSGLGAAFLGWRAAKFRRVENSQPHQD